MAAVEHFAHGYFDAWLKLYHAGSELSEDIVAQRAARRHRMSRTLIELDPDHHPVVQVDGEATTRAIERASLR